MTSHRDGLDGVVHLLHAGVGEVSALLTELHMPAPLVGRHCAPPGLQVQAEDPSAFIVETLTITVEIGVQLPTACTLW